MAIDKKIIQNHIDAIYDTTKTHSLSLVCHHDFPVSVDNGDPTWENAIDALHPLPVNGNEVFIAKLQIVHGCHWNHSCALYGNWLMMLSGMGFPAS